jgi:hypothetical protein
MTVFRIVTSLHDCDCAKTDTFACTGRKRPANIFNQSNLVPLPHPRQFLAELSLATTATIGLVMAAAGRRQDLIYFYKHPLWGLITNDSNSQPNNSE